jgi:acyl-CoA synthetase (AMP-forming)/AMP-acid ligase II
MNCLFYIGGTNIFLERFDPRLFYETVDREKVTTSALVANMVVPLIEYPEINKYDISSLRMIVSAGAPMSPELLKRANDIFGDIFMDVFALTEAAPMLTGPPLFEGPWEKVKRPGSAGKEMLNIEVKAVNENGSEAAPGEIGEIVAKGDNIMMGYWKMPEETARVLRDGYLHTGDLATKDKGGYFYITGRKKDMIVSGGNTIYAAEVEDAIYSHPSVSEIAVIGVPDEALGELVKAVVVLKKGEKTTEKEIIKLCQDKLDSYKVPKSVVFTDSLPKTPTAKVLKSVLKEKYG